MRIFRRLQPTDKTRCSWMAAHINGRCTLPDPSTVRNRLSVTVQIRDWPFVSSSYIFTSIFHGLWASPCQVIRVGLQLVAKFSQEDVPVYPEIENCDFLNVPDQIKCVLPLSDNPYFLRFVFDLVRHLDTDIKMLEEKGDLIIGWILSGWMFGGIIGDFIQGSVLSIESKFGVQHYRGNYTEVRRFAGEV